MSIRQANRTASPTPAQVAKCSSLSFSSLPEKGQEPTVLPKFPGVHLVIPQCRLTAVFHEIVRTHQKLEKHLENASQNKR